MALGLALQVKVSAMDNRINTATHNEGSISQANQT